MMYAINSLQVAGSIQIRSVKNAIDGTLIFSDSDELFYRLGDRKYLYVFQFGVVCFFNMEERARLKQLQRIKEYAKGRVGTSLSEDIVLHVKKDVSKVSYNEVILPEFNEEMIRLVMLHTSQSVALDKYSGITEALLEEAGEYTLNLESRGTLKISKVKLKKLIGKNLTLKNAISENLYIFDTPDLVWENDSMKVLDIKLKNTFDLKNRYRNIHDRIDIIKENLQLFKDIWDHKESSTLEWIIIVLIFVEIVDLFVGKLF